MSAVLFLRIAAIAAAVQGAAHGTLVLTYKPTHGAAEVAVIEAMQATSFVVGGAPRTYWGFYFGYAMMGALTCFIEALVFWQLSRFVTASGALVRAVVAVFILFNVVHALLAARFFFAVPVVFDLLLVLLLSAAIFATMRGTTHAMG